MKNGCNFAPLFARNGVGKQLKKEFIDMFATSIDVVQENRDKYCSR